MVYRQVIQLYYCHNINETNSFNINLTHVTSRRSFYAFDSVIYCSVCIVEATALTLAVTVTLIADSFLLIQLATRLAGTVVVASDVKLSKNSRYFLLLADP